MPAFKVLILAALWAADTHPESSAWARWYIDILSREFPDDDKIVVMNGDAVSELAEAAVTVPNILHFGRVSTEFSLTSDASAYQHALRIAAPSIPDYDVVLFMHSKGASHPFEPHAPLRDHLARTTLNRLACLERLDGEADFLTDSAYLLARTSGIREVETFAAQMQPPCTPLSIGAGGTLYWVTSRVLNDFCTRVPTEFFERPLNTQGFNRYFFESVPPSIFLGLGARPVFLAGAERDPRLNPSCSYHDHPRHNAALVMEACSRRFDERDLSPQHPRPYIFNAGHDLEIAFEA